ncbi:hypothetical protein BLX42_04120 [Pseudomonas sp. SG-MS2]|uniref:hypothetical protein n=1 Tax=Pseudomonas sp. SG-MS2 TaxID=1914534 RepID=UPI00137B6B7C|nr:hypothetical protein [Pseudomonas sp. SG-MS2]KAF1312321.1 hypothetical protein BLX42_04120 [Pseudomonas sp. SG-MS2]
MKRYEREETDNDSDEPQFVQADGDILYRWTDPGEKKIRIWQLAFLALSAVSVGTSISAFSKEKLLETLSQLNIEFFRDTWTILLPLIALFVGVIYSRLTRFEAASFQDIDQRAQTKERLRAAKRLKELETVRNSLSLAPLDQSEKPKDYFEEYMLSLIQTLDKRVSLAEEKASKLLDTGTMYLRRGIYFYIFSIVVWQVAFHFWPATNYMIYGIVSCSLTFLVVEFLAAWFLKQYRSFTDSSMQFVKVRSVFDRYLLSYYSLKQFSDENSKSEMRSLMLKVLEEKAGWPDVATMPPDVNHMVQMFSSVSDALEKIRPFKSTDSGKAN